MKLTEFQEHESNYYDKQEIDNMYLQHQYMV